MQNEKKQETTKKQVLSGILDQLAHTNLVLLTSDARNVTLLINQIW